MQSQADPKLIPVMKSADAIKKDVITNTIKMLGYRGWINENQCKNLIDTVATIHNDDNVYKLKTSVHLKEYELYVRGMEMDDEFDGTMVVVKIINQKISGVKKSEPIKEFMSTYKKYHKILIVDSITEKAEKELMSLPHMEVFVEAFMLLNLVDHVASPQYEVLTQDETLEVLKAYDIKRKEIPKIEENDAASRYLYLTKGQIIRIISTSEQTGNCIRYRVVIHGGKKE